MNKSSSRAGALCVAAGMTLASVPAVAQQPVPSRLTLQQAAQAFGARETIRQASLSPDGKVMATVEPHGLHGSVLRVLDLTDPHAKPADVMLSTGEPERIDWCRWTGQKRLVCMIFGILDLRGTSEFGYVTRLVAVDADAKNVKLLRAATTRNSYGYSLYGGEVIDWNTGQDGHVLIARDHGGGSGNSFDGSGTAVDDVDSNTLAAKTIELPRYYGADFISDGRGRVRVMGVARVERNTAGEKVNYLYRPQGVPSGSRSAPMIARNAKASGRCVSIRSSTSPTVSKSGTVARRRIVSRWTDRAPRR